MPNTDFDAYLAAAPQPQRATLTALRATLEKILPEAEQCISYGFPTFKVQGKGVAGFAAYKNHCSYFPMSGSVLSTLPTELAAYQMSKGALRFPIDKPLSITLVRKLVSVRLKEIAARSKVR